MLLDYHHQLIMQKWLLILVQMKTKIAAEIKDRISDLKDRIKTWVKQKKKNADETLNIIQKILDYNKDAQKHFQLASKVDKEKSKPKPE